MVAGAYTDVLQLAVITTGLVSHHSRMDGGQHVGWGHSKMNAQQQINNCPDKTLLKRIIVQIKHYSKE